MSHVVRVRPHTYLTLLAMAQDTGELLPDLVERIVEEARRSLMLQQASEAYAAIADDPEADAAWRAEIALWDVTVGDGLEPEPEASGLS